MSQQLVSDSNHSIALSTAAPAPTLSRILGLMPTLPGESAEQYQVSLDALIKELGAHSVLQVYLAEKIHDCLWWIRRYQEQKRATVIVRMAKLTWEGYCRNGNPDKTHIRNTLLANKVDKQTEEAIDGVNHTLESIRQEAMYRDQAELMLLDQQIALQTKILAGLQASYEVAFNRKMNSERLQLQNEVIRRNLDGVEVVAVEVHKYDQLHGQR